MMLWKKSLNKGKWRIRNRKQNTDKENGCQVQAAQLALKKDDEWRQQNM